MYAQRGREQAMKKSRRVNYSDAIRLVSEESGLSMRRVRLVLSALSRVLRYETLRASREVVLVDIGTFYLSTRSARKVRLPLGEAKRGTVEIPTTFSVRLRTAQALRER